MCKTVPTDIERYRKMQRYMERRQALRRSAGEVPRSLPTFDPAAASAAEVGSPSTLDGEDQQLAVAAAAGASIPAAETANGSGAAAAGTSAPVQMDTSKLLLIDPCVYNLKEV